MKVRIKVSLIALALLAVPALAGEVPLKQEGRWAQDYTGREADPNVRFGTLPNGLRYAIMRNTTPSDGVAMRMRIGSGSNAERDEEQGLAHFLEHMAFRGSRNIRDGEVVHMLERQGLRFGPDTNAFTAQDETVYMFTFPKADQTALDTGFTLFREIGERLTLAPAAVEAEKGVVLSEERLRDVPPYQAAKANFGNALAGTRAVARWPIGTVQTIKGATPARLRRYYAANYRPDNATIIVVGNIDLAKVEAQIRLRFGGWKAVGKRDHVAPGVPTPISPASEFVAAGAQDLLTLSWVRPLDRRAETEAVDREQVLQLVGLAVLNNRLADRAAKPGSPFVAGQAGSVPSLFGAASLTQIGIAAAPDKWQAGLDAVVEEQRQLLEQGVGAEDLQRATTQVLTLFQTAAANAATRKSSDIADNLIKAVNEDQIATSPAQDLAFVQGVLAAIKPDEVNTALRFAFSGKGPVLFRSAQAGPVTAPVLGQALSADYAKPLSARAAAAAVEWPYSNFGQPGTVLSQVEDKELGTTTVSFVNGSRLIVKPTPFEKDTVQVSVAFGDGRKGANSALAHALWATDLMTLGGTGKLSLGDINRWAQENGKVVNARMSAGTGAFTLTGKTRPKDLVSEMQLLAAYARDPGFRPEFGDKLAAIAPMMQGQLDANAGAVFVREMQRVMAGGNGRFGQFPSQADIAATGPSDLPMLLRGVLAGPADVTIVGDITVAEAIKVTQDTFGAGPVQQRRAASEARITMPPGLAEPYVVNHGGRADQAFYGEFWSLPDYHADPKLSYVADVTAAILQARLVDTVREKLGLTYSPQVEALSSIELAGQGYIGVMIETPPTNFATFHGLLGVQLADLITKPVTADELARAKQPLVEARTKDLETNAYWLGQLPLVLRDPRAKAPTLGEVSGLRAVTPGDIQALLGRYVGGKLSVTIVSKAK